MSSTPDDPTTIATDPAPLDQEQPEPAADTGDAQLDELAPNGGGTSGNHGNGTAG
jgi:hypothetical protein